MQIPRLLSARVSNRPELKLRGDVLEQDRKVRRGTPPSPRHPRLLEKPCAPKHAGFLLFWQPTIQIICDAPFYFGNRQALGNLVFKRIKLRSTNALRFQGRGFRSKYRLHGYVCRSFLTSTTTWYSSYNDQSFLSLRIRRRLCQQRSSSYLRGGGLSE